MTFRVCSKCGRYLPAHLFNKKKGGFGGRDARCKSCQKAYRLVNKNIISKHKAEYYQVNKAEIKAKTNDYLVNHKEEHRENNRRHYLANKERYKELSKQWLLDHPEKAAEIRKRSNSNRRSLGMNPLNRSFDNSHYHHLHLHGDISIGIYIPSELHKSIYHSSKTGQGMSTINKLAMQWFKEKYL